jgi:undecaprenyl-phosphate 4-deoxy-4-formamido-L-arabinose transferase
MDDADTTGSAMISIVVPVYGSAPILPRLIEAIAESLTCERYEVILVHDCGPDDAWSVIQRLSERDARVRGINLRRNVGQHSAIMAGLTVARGKIIVTMDDDLQHAPSDIPLLCSKIEEGFDVCYAQFRNRQHALWKRIGSKLNDRLACILLDKPRDLYLSPFKAMRDVVRDEVVKYVGPSVYLDGLILSVTGNIGTVEVDHHSRFEGRGGYSLVRSISLLLRMSTITSVAPLRLATLAGFGFAALGAVMAVALVIQRFTMNVMPAGWLSLIVTSLVLGGVQLIALGIVGEYVGRIFLEVRKKPQFVVAETSNLNARTQQHSVAP